MSARYSWMRLLLDFAERFSGRPRRTLMSSTKADNCTLHSGRGGSRQERSGADSIGWLNIKVSTGEPSFGGFKAR